MERAFMMAHEALPPPMLLLKKPSISDPESTMSQETAARPQNNRSPELAHPALEYQSTTTCLSAEDHGCGITDGIAHYFGCIKICERDTFFTDANKLWEKEVEYQTGIGATNALETVENLRGRWENNVQREVKRVAILRKALSETGAETHSTPNPDRSLIKNLEESRRAWKEWRVSKGKPDLPEPTQRDSTTGESTPTYKLENDISVPIIQFENYWGSNDPDPRIKGKFPNQKTTIEKLLYERTPNPEDQLIHGGHDVKSGRFKYFHIPSNNMIWVEMAIAKYFGDPLPDLTAMNRQFQRPRKTRTSTLLQERYWRGQLHGDSSSPAHARYMSPMCETISSSVDTVDPAPKNIALFMPYLHWETSRKREQFASEIEKIRAIEADKKAWKEIYKKNQLRAAHAPEGSRPNGNTMVYSATGFSDQDLSTVENVVDATTNGRSNMDRSFSRLEPKRPLACYFLAAADLYEGMTTYRDKALLREYLPLDPPIHPRRTLDQSYYWTLRSTKRRDIDQVVYRGTTAKPEDFHRYDQENNTWPDHEGLSDRSRDCRPCKTSIKKVSRVVMVDQLWMWVLDGKTIITSFPKRYGANKQDYSGIHKSIRTRLDTLSPCSVRTVFEMAIIILDECTKTFFDQAKSPDRQPQVIDEFSKAIGNIMLKQTLAFQRLWDWTEQARKIFVSQGYPDTTDLHITLLDINPEGRLEREVGDVIEELDIMLHIANIHQEIVRKFIEQAEHILDPDDHLGDTLKRGGPPQSSFRIPSQHTEAETSGSSQANSSTGLTEAQADFQAFKLRASECQDRVDCHVKDLEALRRSAKNAAEDVRHLLSMKQQQASVVQAWQAVKQSDESIKQSRSIMVFTLATIVFLPLSFLTSVFGMNNREFGDDWKLRDQFLYIFLISAGVIFISLIFAYSAWVRTSVWSLSTKASTALLVKSGIYELNLRHRKRSDVLHRETHEKSLKMKIGVRDKIHREKADMKKAAAKAKADAEAKVARTSARKAAELLASRRDHSALSNGAANGAANGAEMV